MKSKIYILLIIFAVMACAKEIDYDRGSLDNFLVFNTNAYADSSIQVELTRSTTLLEANQTHYISDAIISLSINNELINEATGDVNGKYNFIYQPKIGDIIQFNVSHDSYESISSIGQILEKTDAEIEDIKLGPNSSYECYNCVDDALHYKLNITDPEGENYYRLIAYMPDVEYDDYSNEYNFKTLHYPAQIYSKDPVLNHNTVPSDDGINDIPYNTYMVFDDALFNGDGYTISFELSMPYYYDEQTLNELFEQIVEHIYIDVQQINKDSYLYYKTRSASEYYGDNPFTEPVRIHTNINGGAGILAITTSNWLNYNK